MTKETKQNTIAKLREAVINYDSGAAENAAKEALEIGIDPIEAVNHGIAEGLRTVGDKFSRSEVYLPHIVMAADAAKSGMAILEKAIPKKALEQASLGKVVIGTVKGDIHDIGKELVASMLRAGGFEVHDLGVDISPEEFIKRSEELDADIIAMSSLMTTTMIYMQDTIEQLRQYGVRDKIKVLVGGGAVTEEWTKKIGADAYAKDAVEAVEVAKKLKRMHAQEKII